MKKNKKNKKKLRPIGRLKKQFWGLLSKYIRMKESNLDGLVLCFTCGKPHYWSDTDAGHFIHGKDKPTGFLEENVHAQCKHCNKWLNGNLEVYEKKMIEKYGKEEVEELKILSHKVFKRDREFYEINIPKYKELVAQQQARLKIFDNKKIEDK